MIVVGDGFCFGFLFLPSLLSGKIPRALQSSDPRVVFCFLLSEFGFGVLAFAGPRVKAGQWGAYDSTMPGFT